MATQKRDADTADLHNEHRGLPRQEKIRVIAVTKSPQGGQEIAHAIVLLARGREGA